MFPFHYHGLYVWFVVADSSVSLYLLIPQYGYLDSLTCFYWFWHMFIPVFLSNCTPVYLHMLKCSCAHTLSCLFTHFIIIIIIIIILRRMRWAGVVAHMGERRGVYRVLVSRPEGKRRHWRPRSRWEDNIKMGLQEVLWRDMDWIDVAKDRVQVAGCCECGNEPSGSIKCEKFLD